MSTNQPNGNHRLLQKSSIGRKSKHNLSNLSSGARWVPTRSEVCTSASWDPSLTISQSSFLHSFFKNFKKFTNVIEECMNAANSARSFKDARFIFPYHSVDTQTIAGVLHAYAHSLEFITSYLIVINRFLVLSKFQPPLIHLNLWFQDWHAGVDATLSSFDNPFNNVPPLCMNMSSYPGCGSNALLMSSDRFIPVP